MKEVKVNVVDLRATMEANRKTHADEVAEAWIGYRASAEAKLKAALRKLRKDGKFEGVYLAEPQDHTGDYDRVLAMLNMTVDTQITLTASEFDQYVRDNWTWALGAKMLNSTYAAAAR